MYRFYCPEADFTKFSVTIKDPHEVHHIKDVLRLKSGAKVQIFNACSQQAQAVIEEAGEGFIQARVEAVEEIRQEAGRIILACAPPKKGKFEFIIEKCTELGVDEIIPLKTKRTEVVFSPDKWQSKAGRFKAVAVNAAKQSKRTKVPLIHPMTMLVDALKALPSGGLPLFPSLHHHPCHITEALAEAGGQKPVTIFIGPEGDFTADELDLAVKYGCLPVSLGSTVLKVETAAIVCVALVKFNLR
ncbi:MAG: 16S rRNA (uracil(1498)-N(3))-methyltransferase [Candidatus Omnitrophica bacterium]|nr:16S rRNA (uracil(1498)-N(3))-methyltransferase [Candidatus Omnitrophota bacterium]MDE2223022.1 16S rRNA (uracil(1498)-N(3))-methyltransferase [Candidatus Omnitrophota bacterium]